MVRGHRMQDKAKVCGVDSVYVSLGQYLIAGQHLHISEEGNQRYTT